VNIADPSGVVYAINASDFLADTDIAVARDG
jgi:hypothetical protein